jgi:hypothetical protein
VENHLASAPACASEYLQGDGTWDKIKRIAMMGFAMRATERDPNFVDNVLAKVKGQQLVQCIENSNAGIEQMEPLLVTSVSSCLVAPCCGLSYDMPLPSPPPPPSCPPYLFPSCSSFGDYMLTLACTHTQVKKGQKIIVCCAIGR